MVGASAQERRWLPQPPTPTSGQLCLLGVAFLWGTYAPALRCAAALGAQMRVCMLLEVFMCASHLPPSWVACILPAGHVCKYACMCLVTIVKRLVLAGMGWGGPRYANVPVMVAWGNAGRHAHACSRGKSGLKSCVLVRPYQNADRTRSSLRCAAFVPHPSMGFPAPWLGPWTFAGPALRRSADSM